MHYGGSPSEMAARDYGVDLYWLPLGAGGHSVRFNGRVYETLVAALEHRVRCDLYHSALEILVPDGRYIIEMASIPDGDGFARGVVAEGAVGSRIIGAFRLFRYEVRCWRGGTIPDVGEAVDSPQRLTSDLDVANRILELVREVPTHVWGRDPLGAHDMWNSNSLTSWLLVGAGLDVSAATLPINGRAPGWEAGVTAAQADMSEVDGFHRVRAPTAVLTR